ncbi:hypothetical protein [Streptomyces sp. NBC_00582]|uniref:hypothetical protein n=1 Tax=Streptomyces sp. NBC_00582 TaxID=2975783 RepID=UPI002E811DAE|nr:hypothetical protein [Streptomyces sp. NBC_00582]WUB59126.1 hypothetical protein OG852_01025 [Streptomyces sp. NBC_00582]WUB67602.1 hypothetical protein OG852_48110 [Streptomyces sp. NBC_00582]
MAGAGFGAPVRREGKGQERTIADPPGLRPEPAPAAPASHRGDFPHQSFATAHDQVRQAYVLDRYRALLARLAGSAQVRVHHKVFDAVPVA